MPKTYFFRTPASSDKQNVSRHCQMSPRGKDHPRLRTTKLVATNSNRIYMDGEEAGFAISGCQVDGGNSGIKSGAGCEGTGQRQW